MSSNYDEFDEFDEFDDDDDFQELIEDDSAAELLDEFDQKVAKRIKFLKSKQSKQNAEQRIRVVAWLGEAGRPQALPILRRLYDTETENTPLRKAVIYALGQFRALYDAVDIEGDETLEDAMMRRENAAIRQQLTDIVTLGKLGKRKSLPPRVMTVIVSVLSIMLVVMVALNLAAYASRANTPPLPTRVDEPTQYALETQVAQASNSQAAVLTALGDLQAFNQTNLEYVEGLRQQFGNALVSSTLDCETRFLLREPYVLGELAGSTYPDLVDLSAQVNAILETVNEIVSQVNDYCQNRSGEISYDDAGEVSRSLVAFLEEFPPVEAALLAAHARVESATISADGEFILPTIAATVPPTETPSPTPAPTATLDPDLAQRHIRALAFNIDMVTAIEDGALGLLAQYWQDIRSSGATAGCSTAQPGIPNDYELIPPEVAAQLPDLVRAKDNVNLAMLMLRESWILFYGGCNADNLPEALETGLQQVLAAQTALDSAREILDTVQEDLSP